MQHQGMPKKPRKKAGGEGMNSKEKTLEQRKLKGKWKNQNERHTRKMNKDRAPREKQQRKRNLRWSQTLEKSGGQEDYLKIEHINFYQK